MCTPRGASLSLKNLEPRNNWFWVGGVMYGSLTFITDAVPKLAAVFLGALVRNCRNDDGPHVQRRDDDRLPRI